MKQKRQSEIEQKEQDVKDLQKQRFGVNGDLFKKRQELVKPLQDKIYTAVQTHCRKGKLMLLFLIKRATLPCFIQARSTIKATMFLNPWDTIRMEAKKNKLKTNNNHYEKSQYALSCYLQQFVFHSASFAQKLGHVNLDSVLKAMPQSDSARKVGQAYYQQLETTIESMQKELQQKYQEYPAKSGYLYRIGKTNQEPGTKGPQPTYTELPGPGSNFTSKV